MAAKQIKNKGYAVEQNIVMYCSGNFNQHCQKYVQEIDFYVFIV
jgi:hypothetical protein